MNFSMHVLIVYRLINNESQNQPIKMLANKNYYDVISQLKKLCNFYFKIFLTSFINFTVSNGIRMSVHVIFNMSKPLMKFLEINLNVS
jgi:hypothetical protein